MTESRTGDGGLRIQQPGDGYRFSMDAVALARSILYAPASRFLDLGTGCGVIPILAAHRRPADRWVGIEIQPELADYARRNVAANGLDERVSIIQNDYRRVAPAGLPFAVEHVVANPPFRQRGSGRVNPNAQRAIARHEILGTLMDLVRAARRCLGNAGWLSVVFPMDRRMELENAMARVGIAPQRIQPLQTGPNRVPRRVVVHACVGRPVRATVEPPLIVGSSTGDLGPGGLDQSVNDLARDDFWIEIG